ncbi:hypothetical protein [Micromonospora globbae]|nr:hypothetical protein OH732_02240 [Micromonospora globbae]
MSPRGLMLLVAALFIGYIALEYPEVRTPILVVVGVLTVLNQMVGRR